MFTFVNESWYPLNSTSGLKHWNGTFLNTYFKWHSNKCWNQQLVTWHMTKMFWLTQFPSENAACRNTPCQTSTAVWKLLSWPHEGCSSLWCAAARAALGRPGRSQDVASSAPLPCCCVYHNIHCGLQQLKALTSHSSSNLQTFCTSVTNQENLRCQLDS